VGANPVGSKYQARTGRDNRPITYVNWYDAARFVNWMHNGQGSSDTETGVYTLLGGAPTPTNGASIARSEDAQSLPPTYDERVKAASTDASAGTAGEYCRHPNASQTGPPSATPADNPAGANSGLAHNGTDVFPDVGAYIAAVSAYG